VFVKSLKNFDILVIRESLRSVNGATHLLEVIESELLSLNYKILCFSPGMVKNINIGLNSYCINNYDYLLFDGLYNTQIDSFSPHIQDLIQFYLKYVGKIIFTTDMEYSKSLCFKNANEQILQTCYPSYQKIWNIVYSQKKEYKDIFNRFGKIIYDNVNSIRELEGFLISIAAFMNLYNISNYDDVEFYFEKKGKPILKTK